MSTTQLDPSATEAAPHTAATGRAGRQAADTAAAVLRRLEAAWNAGDGQRFGAPYAADATFVDIRGEHHRGRDAIAGGHAGIFATIYAGSTNRMELVDARHLADDVIVATSRNTLDVPSGPLAGIHAATSTSVLVRVGDDLADRRHPQHPRGHAMSALVGGTVGEALAGRAAGTITAPASARPSAPSRLARRGRRGLRRRWGTARRRRDDAPARDVGFDAREPPRPHRVSGLAARARRAPRWHADDAGRPRPAPAPRHLPGPGPAVAHRDDRRLGRRHTGVRAAPARRRRARRARGRRRDPDGRHPSGALDLSRPRSSACLRPCSPSRSHGRHRRGPPGSSPSLLSSGASVSRSPPRCWPSRATRRSRTSSPHRPSSTCGSSARASASSGPRRWRGADPGRATRGMPSHAAATAYPCAGVRGGHPSGCLRLPSGRLAHWALQYDTT